jgi:DNA primase
MGSDSPLYPVLIQSIIDNMNISNREQLIQVIQKASQPTPEQQQAQQLAQQVQIEFQLSQTNALNGQAAESQARAQKIVQETKAIPVELENDRIKAVATNLKAGNEDDKEFERRMKVTEKLLEERRLNLETAKALTS